MKGDPRRKNSGEKNGMYGKKHSPETREKMKQAALNRNKNKKIFNS
jgi:NUMOD3 motif